jgi:hypothetical protein
VVAGGGVTAESLPGVFVESARPVITALVSAARTESRATRFVVSFTTEGVESRTTAGLGGVVADGLSVT